MIRPLKVVLVTLIMTVLLTGMLVACSKNDKSPQVLRLSGKTMGTSWHIVIPHTVIEKNPENLNKAILEPLIREELEIINKQFSTYRKDSEISRFNARQSIEPFEVSQPVVDVVEKALQLSRETQGAFDISIAPLVDLWGFGKIFAFTVPDDKKIQQARARTGYQHLAVMQSPPRLIKAIPDLEIDLSAIAKGYAVDRLSERLNAQGVTDFLVEIGGELRVQGLNPQGERWHIAIEKPLESRRSAQRILFLGGSAVATSGDYHNYYEDKGKRYSHTIDPQTGKPVTHSLASVTVLHDSAMIADALATAFMVMGDKNALAYAKKHNLQIYMLLRDEKVSGGIREISTLRPDVAMTSSSGS